MSSGGGIVKEVAACVDQWTGSQLLWGKGRFTLLHGKMHSSDIWNVQYITYNTSETTCCLHRCTHDVYPANEVPRMYITESFTTDFAFSSTADDDLGLIFGPQLKSVTHSCFEIRQVWADTGRGTKMCLLGWFHGAGLQHQPCGHSRMRKKMTGEVNLIARTSLWPSHCQPATEPFRQILLWHSYSKRSKLGVLL